MDEVLQNLKNINQHHLLRYQNELSKVEQAKLLQEISQIDFNFMQNLYVNSYHDTEIDLAHISPLNCIYDLTDEEKIKFQTIGQNLVSEQGYAIVLFAGGSGSRLGSDKPKGCLELTIKGHKKTLFEIYLDQLKKIYETLHVYIDLYIMLSSDNFHFVTTYFAENNFFAYPKNKIHFFVQDNLPILDTKGHVLLKDKSSILMGPNGNGNVFCALKKAGYIEEMFQNKIKFVLFSTIDNVLTNLVDFKFIGATMANNYNLASKTILKKSHEEKDWVFCKYHNRPYMLPTAYINNEITDKQDASGHYLYRGKNITYHLISTDLIKTFAECNLPYHRAYKKYDYIDFEGNFVHLDSPSTFKFEQFVFDAFYYAKDMLLYKTDKQEFCPIKVENDIKKAEEVLNKCD